MAKKIDKAGKAYKVTVATPMSGQYVSHKSHNYERTTISGEPSPPSTSYTFHGDRKITTSGVPIKSR